MTRKEEGRMNPKWKAFITDELEKGSGFHKRIWVTGLPDKVVIFDPSAGDSQVITHAQFGRAIRLGKLAPLGQTPCRGKKIGLSYAIWHFFGGVVERNPDGSVRKDHYWTGPIPEKYPDEEAT